MKQLRGTALKFILFSFFFPLSFLLSRADSAAYCLVGKYLFLLLFLLFLPLPSSFSPSTFIIWLVCCGKEEQGKGEERSRQKKVRKKERSNKARCRRLYLKPLLHLLGQSTRKRRRSHRLRMMISSSSSL